jgi:hypothetical protein
MVLQARGKIDLFLEALRLKQYYYELLGMCYKAASLKSVP